MNKEFVVDKGTYVTNETNCNKMRLYWFITLVVFSIFAILKNGLLPYLSHKTDFMGMMFPVLFLVTSCLAAIITNLIGGQLLKQSEVDRDVIALNQGLLLALILPMNTPLLVVSLGNILAMISYHLMKKYTCRIIIPPALIGWIMIMALYFFHLLPTIDYMNPMETDLGMPLGIASINNHLGTYSQLVEPYGSLLDFFIGLVPGAMGVTSILLAVIVFLFLMVKGMIKWRIPVVTIGTVFLITYMIGEFSHLGIWYPLFQICSGSLVFGSLYLATYSDSSPVTAIGQILYALFLAVVIVALRYLTPLTDASLVGILIMVPFTRLFDYLGAIARFNFNKSLVVFIIVWALILFLGCFLGIHYLKETKLEVPFGNVQTSSL